MSYKRNTSFYETRENLLNDTFWLKAQIPVSKWSDFATIKHDPIIVESFITKLKTQLSKLDVKGLPSSLRFLNGRSDIRDAAPMNALYLHYWNMAWTLEKLLTIEMGHSSTQLFTLKNYMRSAPDGQQSGDQIIDFLVSAPQRLALALTPSSRNTSNDNFLFVASEINHCMKLLERLNTYLDPEKTLSSDLILGVHVLSSFAEAYNYTTPLMNHILGLPPLSEQIAAMQGFRSTSAANQPHQMGSRRITQVRPVEMTDVKEILTSQMLEVVNRSDLSADYKAAEYILGKENVDITDPIFHPITETLTNNFILASKRYLFDVTVHDHMNILYGMTKKLSDLSTQGPADVTAHLKRAQIFMDSVLECTIVTLEKVFYQMTNLPAYLAHLMKTSPILCGVRRDVDNVTSHINVDGLIGYPKFVATGLYVSDQMEIEMLKARSKEFEDIHAKLGPYLDQQHKWMENKISEPSHRRTGMNVGNKVHYANMILSVNTAHVSTTFVGPRTANPRIRQLGTESHIDRIGTKPEQRARAEAKLRKFKSEDAMIVRHSYEHTLQSSFGDEDLEVNALLTEAVGTNGIINLIPNEYYLWFVACYGEKKAKIARRVISHMNKPVGNSKKDDSKLNQPVIAPQEIFEVYIGHTGFVTVVLIPGSYEIRSTSIPSIAPLVSSTSIGLVQRKYTSKMLEEKPIALLQVVDYLAIRSLKHDYLPILDQYIQPRLSDKYDGGKLGLPIVDLIHIHDRYTPHAGISLGLQSYTMGGDHINAKVIGNCFIPSEVYSHGMIELQKDGDSIIPLYLLRNYLKEFHKDKATVGLLDPELINSIKRRLKPVFTARSTMASMVHNCWCETDRFIQLDFLLPAESILNYEHVPTEFLVPSKSEFISKSYSAPGTTSLYLAVNPGDTSLVRARVYVDLFHALQNIQELQVSLRGSISRRYYNKGSDSDDLSYDDKVTFADPFISSLISGFTSSDAVYNSGNLESKYLITRERRSALAFFDGVREFVLAFYTQLHQLDYDFNSAMSDWNLFRNTLAINLAYFGLDLSASVSKYSTTLADTMHTDFNSALSLDEKVVTTKEAFASHLLTQFPSLLRTPTNMLGSFKTTLEAHQMNFALDVGQISRVAYPQIVPTNSTRLNTPYAILPMVQDLTEEFINSWIDSHIKRVAIKQ